MNPLSVDSERADCAALDNIGSILSGVIYAASIDNAIASWCDCINSSRNFSTSIIISSLEY